jgi:hypothetical protein
MDDSRDNPGKFTEHPISDVVPSPLVAPAHAEGGGVSAAARAASAHAVGIPMRPGADSLNVATAAAIALHRLTRAALDPPH